jgi:hypothetical protein
VGRTVFKNIKTAFFVSGTQLLLNITNKMMQEKEKRPIIKETSTCHTAKI